MKREIYKWFNCPELYGELYFLLNPIKTLRWFANPDTIKSPYVQNLVNAYNEEYAVKGKSTITPETLCITRYNAFQTNFFEIP